MPINYNDYPPNWKTEIRPRILERENHCCKFCGVPNYAIIDRDGDDPRQVYGEFDGYGEARKALPNFPDCIVVVLTIMHLDHDTSNNADENLAAGCQRCHNRHDSRHRRKNAAKTRRKKRGGLELNL